MSIGCFVALALQVFDAPGQAIDAGDHQNVAFLLIGAEDNSPARREEVRRCDKSQAGSPNLPIG